MRLLISLVASQLLIAIVPALAAEPAANSAAIKTPEEQFKAFPNQLADIPPGWSTSNPIRLQVSFNLKYPPNSPEANEFLQTWYRTIKAMPYGVQLKMERVVFPAKFSYCASLTFRNWQNNRAYETSEAFLKYYREQWKPAVTEAAEQMTVLDAVVTR